MDLHLQYRFVISSRQVLLEYCGRMAETDFIAENSSFGRGGSIRNLLVHIGNTYEFWIGKQALHMEPDFTAYSSVQNVVQAKALFGRIDSLVSRFMTVFVLYKLK